MPRTLLRPRRRSLMLPRRTLLLPWRTLFLLLFQAQDHADDFNPKILQSFEFEEDSFSIEE
jgi:hypothetical protein